MEDEGVDYQRWRGYGYSFIPPVVLHDGDTRHVTYTATYYPDGSTKITDLKWELPVGCQLELPLAYD